MSDECPITGFDNAQQHRWPLVHQYLCDKLELPNGDGLETSAMEKLSKDIEKNTLRTTPKRFDVEKAKGLV
ncbi:hypothetical protein N9M45_02500 [Euryarchaeota archaeon]|nr:hypothetical protein [Euryarchaeota archaeon]